MAHTFPVCAGTNCYRVGLGLVKNRDREYMGQRDHHYYVYIVASRTHFLYCGVTNNIRHRVEEHREATVPGFTEMYQCKRLVWFERYQYIRNAIERESKSSGGDERKRYG
jgi:putative endonuclease